MSIPRSIGEKQHYQFFQWETAYIENVKGKGVIFLYSKLKEKPTAL